MLYVFEDYALDTERRELHRGADAVPITPQVFDLLDYLIRNRERVVSKDDLVSAVWNGRIVSDAALTTRLNAARNAIGDFGETQGLIKTLPRKGFRFVGAVREDGGCKPKSVGSAVLGDDTTPTQATAPRLSIVVLPFANLSDDGQDYFVDGVTENLTTDLSLYQGLIRHWPTTQHSPTRVRRSIFKQIGRELNVRYALEGSVQRNGNRLRVNVQLVDAETGNHLWAERFDKPVADLFELQDEIVARLANTLETQLIEAEARRAERSPHPNSMDLYFQGMAWFNKGPTPDHMARARSFFQRALALDPGSVEALVGLAYVDGMTSFSLSDNQVAGFAVAEAASTKALSLAPDNALAHLALRLHRNLYEPRGPRHRRMRTSATVEPKSGGRARYDRCGQNPCRARC